MVQSEYGNVVSSLRQQAGVVVADVPHPSVQGWVGGNDFRDPHGYRPAGGAVPPRRIFRRLPGRIIRCFSPWPLLIHSGYRPGYCPSTGKFEVLNR
jgi:hypothetical protein